MSEIFLSNRYEKLASKLKERIVSQDPLFRRYIVVESAAVKEWLMRFFASSEAGVCMGLSFIGMEEVLSLFSEKKFPSSMELFFAIIEELRTLSSSDAFAPLVDYIQEEKKLVSLAQTLSRFLTDYGTYESKEKGWQETLWKRVFEKRGWLYHRRLLTEVISPMPWEIHLFDPTSLPEIHAAFFEKVSHKIPVYYYLLSPCMDYWGEEVSDRELKALKRRYKKVPGYFEERNSLLGNWGKMQKEILRALDGYDSVVEEDYEPAEGKSLLHQIQNGILTFSSPVEKRVHRVEGSLQIHRSASSLFREVEILYDRLIDLRLEGGDILVLAPDIEPYIPFIHLVFGRKDSFLDVKILSEKASSEPLFLQILEMASKEISITEIEKIWEDPSFQKRFDLSAEELDLWKGWMKDAGVRFAWESSSPYQTLEYALSRILSGLILEKENPSFLLPLSGIDLTQAETADKLLRFWDAFQKDILFFRKNPKLSLASWEERLRQVIAAYSFEEKESEPFLQALRRASLSFPSEMFDFMALCAALKKESEKRRSSFQGFLQHAVTFASLKKGALFPAHVICLIGMEEESFPRFSPPISLNTLHHLAPKRQEEDRCLFLRALLLAKETLLFTYKEISPEDGRKTAPSLLLQQLGSYLEERGYYEKGASLLALSESHPCLPFDERLFDGKHPRMRSFNAVFHRALGKKKERREEEILRFPFPAFSPPSVEEKIDLKDLAQFSKNPWKFTLNKTFGIYLEKNEREEFEEGEFSFSHLQEYLVKKESLQRPYQEILVQREKEGKLPAGIFGESAKREVERELRTWEKGLYSLGVKKEEFFTEKLSLRVQVEGKEIELTGEIPFVSKQGLLLLHENTSEKLISSWPLILAYLSLSHPPTLFFAKKASSLSLALDDPLAALSRYLSYFLRVKGSFSPFRPEWAEGFLRNDPDLLEKKMRQENRFFEDPYEKLLLQDKILCPAHEILADWSECFKEVFHGI